MYLAAKCGGSPLDFFGMFSDPIGEMIKMVAKIVMRGALGIFDSVGEIDSYDEAASNEINSQIQWIVVYLSIGSILFAAIKMALDRRGEAGQTALKGVMRVTLVNTAASSVIITFIVLMDRYSHHLFEKSLENLMRGIDCSDDIPAMLLLVVGCLLLLAGIIHALLMWIRLGVMIILMGTFPLAAAASMSDWGGNWWRKHLGWLIAWLLYKPTVSLVLYSGSVMVNADNTSQTNTQIAGMGVLLLSAIALPALMRVIVPATEALGGDSVGQATMGIAGGIASGAKSIAGGALTRANPAAAAATAAKAPTGASGSSGSSPGRASGGSGGGGGGSGGRSGGGSGESRASGSSGGGGSSSGGGGSSSGGGGSSSGGGSAAAARAPLPVIGAAVLGAAAVAAKTAKGAANITASGVSDANRNSDRH
ncbi:hypothetical protein [Streptomyces ziwulingensis]|uniref:TrbL/VirB6 plasmid conjugal transfer protein n=1 Tax=Streptomyces ziwulingensis TaxID=1045501 RepID=A0ABP9B3B4_9ACTN